jgi:uncharacterized delta-60 repeat protein
LPLLGALAALVLLPPPPATAQRDGENDDSFWGDGKRVYTWPDSSLQLRGLTVMPDGNLVYGAEWSDGMWHSHWRSVGDATHGTPCNVALPGYDEFSLRDVATDAQGRLLVLGLTGELGGDINHPFVARYLYPECTPDGTFSQDGWTVLSWDAEFVATPLFRLFLQPDGKLVLAGIGYQSGSLVPTPIAFRLLPSGALDTGFSNDGRTRATYESGPISSAALTPSGKLLMTTPDTDGNSDFILLQFDTDGTFVERASIPFDLVTNGSDFATSVAVAPDDTIYVSGWVQSSTGIRAGVAAMRFLPDGFLARDFGFSHDGRFDFTLAPEAYSEISASLVQDDGKLVVVGRASDSHTDDAAMAVARILPSGALDPKFFPTSITHGLRLVEFDLVGDGEDAATRVLLQNGRIVLGGSAELLSGDQALALARLHNANLFADSFETGDDGRWVH